MLPRRRCPDRRGQTETAILRSRCALVRYRPMLRALRPSLRPAIPVLLLASLAAALACNTPRAETEVKVDPLPGPSNVLLITVDTLRADHLSAWGYIRPPSPVIDRMAAEGVRFEQA